ncbi:hypothetical protein VKT23_014726 [Stygiomarasmius scandens]|uniref:Uncharacterized protein n=1 Tax=Marasmiellus scandens TaxID=2682957 RepID=A0ABR1J2E6_9AGAR
MPLSIPKKPEFLRRAYPYLYPSYRPKPQWHKKVKTLCQRRLSRSISGKEPKSPCSVFSTSPLSRPSSAISSSPPETPTFTKKEPPNPNLQHSLVSPGLIPQSITSPSPAVEQQTESSMKKSLPPLPKPSDKPVPEIIYSTTPVEQDIGLSRLPPPPPAKLHIPGVIGPTTPVNTKSAPYPGAQKRALPMIPGDDRMVLAKSTLPNLPEESDIIDLFPPPPPPSKHRNTPSEGGLAVVNIGKQPKAELPVHEKSKQASPGLCTGSVPKSADEACFTPVTLAGNIPSASPPSVLPGHFQLNEASMTNAKGRSPHPLEPVWRKQYAHGRAADFLSRSGTRDEEMLYPSVAATGSGTSESPKHSSSGSHLICCGFAVTAPNPTTFMINLKTLYALLATAFLIIMSFLANI